MDTSPALNAQIDWDGFDAAAYQRHNYRTLRDDDQQIIHKVRDYFAAASIGSPKHGLDIGAGPNLYPAMSMLPFCNRIDLREFGADNLTWLRRQVAWYDDSWDPFWSEYTMHRAYRLVADPRARMREIAHVRRGSIFELPRRTWDIGTMFFVACSISNDLDEFERAVHRFVRSLKVGAPFAAAFMIGSHGYSVGGQAFPSVEIDIDEVYDALNGVAYSVNIDGIKTSEPLRTGYSGMCLATGRASA